MAMRNAGYSLEQSVRGLNQVPKRRRDLRTHKRLESEVLHARELCADWTKRRRDVDAWLQGRDATTMARGAYVMADHFEPKCSKSAAVYLGEDHPDTVAAMNNLAWTLMESRRSARCTQASRKSA